MTWLETVASALRPVLSASRSRVCDQSEVARDTHGPALITAPKSSANGKPPVDLKPRALRLCNRCPKATALYLAKIEALSKGC